MMKILAAVEEVSDSTAANNKCRSERNHNCSSNSADEEEEEESCCSNNISSNITNSNNINNGTLLVHRSNAAAHNQNHANHISNHSLHATGTGNSNNNNNNNAVTGNNCNSQHHHHHQHQNHRQCDSKVSTDQQRSSEEERQRENGLVGATGSNNSSTGKRDRRWRKDLADSPIKGEVTLEDEARMRVLLPFHLAPEYLRFNPYILRGYRGYLTTKLCIESIFWWTNETINIWSHILGCILFLGLTFYDLCLVNIHAPMTDKLLVALLLVCFQVCMVLSSIYHTFSCRSEKDYWFFLSYDLFGVALSLLAIYLSGVYYAFWCHRQFQWFYLITVLSLFILAIILQLPRFEVDQHIKLAVFVGWAAYGVVPTLHWSVLMGGMENPMVNLLLPRVLGMYLISGAAFLIYFSKIPERFCPGWVDYVGSSHQWWHALVVLALYYWHNTGVLYVEFRTGTGCMKSPSL